MQLKATATHNGKRSGASRRHFFRSIRTRLIVCFSLAFGAVLVIVGLLGLVGVPFTSYTGRVAAEKAEAFRNLSLIADIKKDRLLRWLEERRRDVHVASDSNLVKTNVALLRTAITRLSGGDKESGLWGHVREQKSYHALQEFMEALQTSYEMYDRIFIADAGTGAIFLSTRDTDLGSDALHHACFIGALRSEDYYVSDIEFDDEHNTYALYVGHVIDDVDLETFADKEGEAAAVLMAEIHSEAILKPMLHTGEGLGRTGEALLVNRNVRILTSLKHPLSDGTTSKPLEYKIQAEPAMLAAGGEEGIIEAKDYRGEPVLAAYRHIRVMPEFGWGMVVKRDKAELFAPMRADVVYTALTGVFGIIVVVALTSVLVRRFTGPIVALGSTADRVAKGDLGARATVTTSDEVGRLGTTFNSMVDRIQNWRRELEEQVAARTAELKQSNVELVTEITERKRAEEARRIQQEFLVSALESLTHPFCVIDAKDYTIKLSNSAANLRCLPEGPTCHALIHGQEKPCAAPDFTCPLERVKETKKPVVVEHVHSGGDGRQRTDEVHGFPILDGEGEVVEIIVYLLDITERRWAEEAARTAQEKLLGQQRGETQRVETELNKTREQLINQTRLASVGQVAASIAHELRNPLGAARNAAYYLQHYVARPESDLIEHVKIIDEEIQAADQIITDLMNMTRSRSPDRQELDFGPVVHEILERARLGDGISCSVTLDPDPFMLEADPGQFRQVIGNLLTNAAEALAGRGEISIEASRKEDCSEIIVQDNGPGVSAGHRGRLFEPLFTTKAKGTGLGLTICREIIERHSGSIELVDQGQPGATFRIRLPR